MRWCDIPRPEVPHSPQGADRPQGSPLNLPTTSRVNAARMDFLYENRYDVSEETMSAAMQARLWPKNMVGVVEVATLKAIRERQQHEKFLRNRTEALRLALEEVTSQELIGRWYLPTRQMGAH
eukprot:9221315-Pyramimonas_sp.AAC.1